MYANLATLALFAFAYSVVASRVERTPISGAVVYLAFGVFAGPVALGMLEFTIRGESLRLIAELTLALVLFSDAANADLSVLRSNLRVPGRMLLVGLPLCILSGFGVGVLLFPELPLLQIALLATMLAPTDAALGEAVVTNPAVPRAVREGLNLESGLNDGICVPVLFTFLALASESGGRGGTALVALTFVAEEIGIGGAVGLATACLGAWALKGSLSRRWIEGPWLGLPIAALALASFSLAQLWGGSGFIASFVGGLLFGALVREHKHVLLEGAEATGDAFSMITWVVFGAAVVFQHSGTIDARVVVYALASLTVIRMLPVFVSLVGLGVPTGEKLFLGWFGPRGLASIVFIVIVVDAKLDGSDLLVGTVMTTVVLSILAHGLSANPLASRFGASQRS